MAEEAERDLPLNERFTASTFGLGRPLVARVMKRHRQLYPVSELRKKLMYWKVAGVLTLLALASTAFSEK
jgi:hypothetical protein